MPDPEIARPVPQLSSRVGNGHSSAIRELLSQANQPGMISLAGGLPDPTQFPTRELAAIAHRVIAVDGRRVLQYGETAGDASARAAVTSLFDDPVDPNEVVVTTGSQQALDLIARVMVDPGDQIVVGDPDYLGALQVFRSYGADLRPIAVDNDGLNTEQLAEELRWGLRPKAVYVVPNFHNPTGVTMSAERRRHLGELASTYGYLVIEDDPYRELYFDDRPADVLLDPERTVRLRSTSKTLAPGFRVGVLAGPGWLTDPIITAKQSVDLHSSTLSQAMIADALASPWFDDHLGGLRALYRSKRDVLVAALAETFGERATVNVPGGGMFVWVQFRTSDTSSWLQRCLAAGVCFVPGAAFAVQCDLSAFARLSFATGSESELAEAVERMHQSW